MTPLRFNLNRARDVTFELSVAGQLAEGVVPRFRFAITDATTGAGVVVPATLGADGNVVVRVPALAHVFAEGQTYEGALEMHMGEGWLAPATVDVVFSNEAVVTAKPKTATDVDVAAILEELDAPPPAPTPPPPVAARRPRLELYDPPKDPARERVKANIRKMLLGS